MSAFVKLALAAVLALGVALGLKLEGAAPPPHAPASALAAPRLDATSDAEARQMRQALTTLAGPDGRRRALRSAATGPGGMRRVSLLRSGTQAWAARWPSTSSPPC